MGLKAFGYIERARLTFKGLDARTADTYCADFRHHTFSAEETPTITTREHASTSHFTLLKEHGEWKIRMKTAKECFRLMGFSERKEVNGSLIHDDTAYERARAVNKDKDLYVQAGNSIVVDVLYEIFKEMIQDE